jgi:hypothetical protein
VSAPTKVAIIYDPAVGTAQPLARAAARALTQAGAQVRLRTVPRRPPGQATAWYEDIPAHRRRGPDLHPVSLADLGWAEVLVFGVSVPPTWRLVTAKPVSLAVHTRLQALFSDALATADAPQARPSRCAASPTSR